MNKTTSIYYALVFVPALLLLLTWQRILTRRVSLTTSSVVTVKLPLLITTGSGVLFFLVFGPATGVHYGDTKLVVIVTAFGVSLAMALLSLLGKRPFGWPLS